MDSLEVEQLMDWIHDKMLLPGLNQAANETRPGVSSKKLSTFITHLSIIQ